MDWLTAIPREAWVELIKWGPGLVILLGFYLMAKRILASLGAVANTALTEFLASHKAQSEAITKLAVCIEGNAKEGELNQRLVMVQLGVIHQDIASLTAAFRQHTEK